MDANNIYTAIQKCYGGGIKPFPYPNLQYAELEEKPTLTNKFIDII